tara:strand:- start:59 stop:445 length:387 start_codon:yes stop_codon:yes gene_type:complete
MLENFKVEIISPDRLILKTDANQVVIPSYEGEIGILKDHIPLITFLRPGFIKIFNTSEEKFFVEEGTVEFTNNSLLILTSTAQQIKKLSKKTLDFLINEAEKNIDKDNLSDKEKFLLSYKLEALKSIN